MNTSDVPLPFASGKRISDLATLARSPLLAPLSVRELGVLVDVLDQVAVPAGSVVLLEGEAGEYAYFVLEGEAHARRGSVGLRPLRAGDPFGELALLGVRDRATSVEATTTLRLARLSRARFTSLVAAHPMLGVHLLTALGTSLGAELRSMTENVGLLLRPRAVSRRTQVKIERETGTEIVAMGTSLGSILAQSPSSDGALVVAGLLNARPVTLDTKVTSDAKVAPITLASWEGREVYRRSAGLLLLEAAHRVAPHVEVRLGPSVGAGQVALLAPAEGEDRSELARRVARAMKTIRGEKEAFREELWTVEEARTMFAERGWNDAASLLRTWRDATVSLVSCGDVYAIRSGPLLPSVDLVGEVSVAPHRDGLLLDFGEAVRAFLPVGDAVATDPTVAEPTSPRFGGTMEQQHLKWLASMGIDSIGAFNEACVTGRVSQLVRISEGFHEKRIGLIADAIARKGGVRVICIAGPSSSGKTTFIKRLTVQLEVEGLHPVGTSLDDYYVDRTRLRSDADGVVDFEAFDAIDASLLRDHVRRALHGETVKTARFDFHTGESHPDGGGDLTIGPRDILLVEGIHGLNPELLGDAVADAQIFRVFVHCGTSLPFDRLTALAREDVRLLRRIVRDRHARGYTAAENIARWPQVRRGEERHIYPHLSQADEVFDASLVYEPAVLKVFAERYLLEVPEGDPSFTTAHRLRHLVDRFVAIYPDHVPPTSILREFIGGSGFEY